jgi:hypothetical protein
VKLGRQRTPDEEGRSTQRHHRPAGERPLGELTDTPGARPSPPEGKAGFEALQSFQGGVPP